MTVQMCTLVDVRDPSDHAKWIVVTPQSEFTDNDGVSHSAPSTFMYVNDALPSTAKVPRSDAAGNSPTPVYYTIRRVLAAGGPGSQTWTDVLLDVDTANLNNLTQVPNGGPTVVDPDLTALAALDSTTPGMPASDGAGWIKKTYAQVKTALSLGNVDNTSDVNKPVSTAQQAAINLAISNLVAGAPGALDTLLELANQLSADESVVTALTSAVALKEPILPAVGSFTYNADGTVASDADGNTYTYNADGTVHTQTRGGVTRTYTYNAAGTVASVA